MIQAALFLGCILLSSVTAFPWKTQNGDLTAVTETESTSDVFSSKIPPLIPSNCQNLLHIVPPVSSLTQYLSALRFILEKIGCPPEAHSLHFRHTKMGGKDGTETLILESPNRSQDEETGNNEVILRHLVPSPEEMKRVRRSVTLPEACTSEPGWLFYEVADLMIELVEKFPSTELVREVKASAVSVTHQCTMESWEHLNGLIHRLMSSPEIKDVEISIADRVHMFGRLTVLVNRVFTNLLLKYFQTYFE